MVVNRDVAHLVPAHLAGAAPLGEGKTLIIDNKLCAIGKTRQGRKYEVKKPEQRDTKCFEPLDPRSRESGQPLGHDHVNDIIQAKKQNRGIAQEEQSSAQRRVRSRG